jgi:CheY-like chemotaxis protein
MSLTERNMRTSLQDETTTRALMVLVVDDEKDLRDGVCELLAGRGYNVVCAEDGRVALEMLRSGDIRPDLILLDLMMPGMNGWQFREVQTNDPAIATIPVVVITATRNLREINADDILHKPVKPAELLRIVEQWGRKKPASASVTSISVAAPSPAPAKTAPGSARMPVAHNGNVDRTAMFSERFVEMLGHDLRNPLSAISISGGLLSYHATTPEVAEPTARILAIVDRMDLMIAHLLDFLRYCLGRDIPLNLRDIDLGDVAERISQTLTRATGRTVTVEAAPGARGTWDKTRMEMLVATLVTESFDNDQQNRPVHVKVIGSQDGIVRLEVTHQGISSLDLLSLQSDRGGEENIEEECTRLGLGMYVARQIVRAHGGNMRVESNDADGTRFTVELPREFAAR